MRDLPAGIEIGALLETIGEGWAVSAVEAVYAPVGFGSYHWVVTDSTGRRRFVTVDDLDQKPWLGATREAALDGLTRAFATAAALRATGLDFVVAPLPASDGHLLRRIGSQHTVGMFPFVEGEAGEAARFEAAGDRASVVAVLARLHGATPAVATLGRRAEIAIPGRRQLDGALLDLGRPWTGGPFAESARAAVAARAKALADRLAAADRLARDVARGTAPWVVTHGEPHARNMIRTADGLRLVDWDTVALAPRERDLWLAMDETGDEADAYARLTGHRPDPAAMRFHRLAWDLADVAAFVAQLRAPHIDSDDARKAERELTRLLADLDPGARNRDPGGMSAS